jgi:hypothetical protein
VKKKSTNFSLFNVLYSSTRARESTNELGSIPETKENIIFSLRIGCIRLNALDRSECWGTGIVRPFVVLTIFTPLCDDWRRGDNDDDDDDECDGDRWTGR